MAAPVEARPALRPAVFIVAVLAAMIVVRLLFLGQPAGRDEAGFLIVGGSWDHGPWLYGDYWVDRPPLLIWIMELAGNVTALRLIGLLASVLMVLGVARAAHVARGPRAAMWAAATAALFSSAHWFGVPRTNGEMLASPFVAWGIALAAQALLRPSRRSWLLGLSAGVLAAGAVLIKQTIVDGLVFAAVLAAILVWQHPARRREIVKTVGAGVGGLALGVLLGLLAASARGTTPHELFEALVTFRAEAGEVIRTSASSATTDRFWVLLGTWAISGLALVTALTAWHGARRREPVVLATFAVIGFVSGAALLGGSYWAHYLLQLVPAAALAVGLIIGDVRARLRLIAAAIVLTATAANLIFTLVATPDDGSDAQVVGRWLKEAGQPSDTAVVAYGQPNVLGNADMTSPYPYLWSLPVRTLDPDLATLSDTLEGDARPTWFVDWSGIGSWGIRDPRRVTDLLNQHYREVASICGRTIWLDRTETRTLAASKECP